MWIEEEWQMRQTRDAADALLADELPGEVIFSKWLEPALENQLAMWGVFRDSPHSTPEFKRAGWVSAFVFTRALTKLREIKKHRPQKRPNGGLLGQKS